MTTLDAPVISASMDSTARMQVFKTSIEARHYR